MIKSMTGFGSRKGALPFLGSANVELRSSNHKFLEIVSHLPEGFLALEDKIKKEIERRIRRGRVTCAVNIMEAKCPRAFINKDLLKNYVLAIKGIKRQLRLPEEASLDTLLHLPGVLSVTETRIPGERIWPRLKILVHQALDDLAAMRQKEGRAMYAYLHCRTEALKTNLERINRRFKKAIPVKLAKIKTDEERTGFLKDADITEEVERLAFHIKNFLRQLSGDGQILLPRRCSARPIP
jgi:uncharacterized protein (TIGR00255 family)